MEGLWLCEGQGQRLTSRSSSLLVTETRGSAEAPRGISEASSRHHSWFSGQWVCPRVPPRSREASVSSKLNERKTKFHHKVDHLWTRTFQERPLERGLGKVKTLVLREHGLKGTLAQLSTVGYDVAVVRYSTLPTCFVSNFKLLCF